MRPFEVYATEGREFPYKEPVPNAVNVAPKGWLQTLAWKFLNRVGAVCPAFVDRIKVTRHRVDPKSLLDELYRQRREAHHMLNGGPASRVVMGPEDYMRLMKETEPMLRHFVFDAEGRDGRGRILDLKIEIIPWMEGVLVLP